LFIPYMGTSLSLVNEKRWLFYLFGLHCLQLNWYNNKHVKLFLFLFGPVNLHSDSWILQLKKSEWLVGQQVFREDWWQRQRFFFFYYQLLIIVTTIDLSIVNNVSQTGRKVAVFHWPAKVWYPCMAWTNWSSTTKCRNENWVSPIRVPSPNG
jgi:hypothetical protein